VNLERAPLKLQRSIMSKGEKKKGEGKKEGKEMGSPRQPLNNFFQGQSDLQIAGLDVAPLKFEMAPLNLKRAINFHKFKKKKSFICRLLNLIGVVSRFK
jgi:hypothetical protein